MLFSQHSPFAVLRKRLKVIVLVGIIGALAGVGISLLFPLEYRADAEVFIISKSRYGVDPYTIVRSAERIGENIAQVMGSDDFYEKVKANTEFPINEAYFEDATLTDRLRRKRWEKSVQASVVFGTGSLQVSAYSRNPAEASALARAVVETLAARGWEYAGGDVTIKVVNAPIVSRFPVRPNIPFNALMGGLAGMAWMAVAVLRRDRA